MQLFKRQGSPYWFADVTIAGRRIKKSLKTTSKAEAQTILLKMFGGNSVHLRNQWQDVELSLYDAIENSYALRDIRDSSLRRYRSISDSIKEFLKRPAVSYRPDELAEIVSLYEVDHSKSSVNNLIIIFRQAYVYLMETFGIPDATGLLRTRKRTKKVRNQFLEKSEFLKLNKFQYTIHKQRADMTLLMYYTGLRLGEAVMLEWQDINFEANVLTVREKPHRDWEIKDDEEREIPMHKEVIKALIKRMKISTNTDAQDLIFPGVGLKTHYSRDLKRDCARVGVQSITAHILRHSFGTNLVRSGAPITVVKDLMGHSDIATTMIYQNVLDKDRQNAISGL